MRLISRLPWTYWIELMLLDCFEANWGYANYLITVLLGASRTGFAIICDILGPIRGH